MSVKTTVVGAWVEGAVKNWFTEEEDGRRMMGRAWRPHLKGDVDDEGIKKICRSYKQNLLKLYGHEKCN